MYKKIKKVLTMIFVMLFTMTLSISTFCVSLSGLKDSLDKLKKVSDDLKEITDGADSKKDANEVLKLDGDVTVKKSSFSTSISGVVKNTSSDSYSLVTITFNLYDNDGTLVGTATDYVSEIAGNGKWALEATALKDFDKYQLKEINGSKYNFGSKSNEKSDFELVGGIEGTTTKSNTFATYISGKVKNNSKKDYSYVQITFNLYDNDGAIVGTALANISGLEAGGEWKFEAMAFEDFSKYSLKEITGW